MGKLTITFLLSTMSEENLKIIYEDFSGKDMDEIIDIEFLENKKYTAGEWIKYIEAEINKRNLDSDHQLKTYMEQVTDVVRSNFHK